jgi:hypothetical protein
MWLGELARLLAGPADLGLDREAMLAELAWGLLTVGRWRSIWRRSGLLGLWLEVFGAEGTGRLAEDGLDEPMAVVLTYPAVQRSSPRGTSGAWPCWRSWGGGGAAGLQDGHPDNAGDPSLKPLLLPADQRGGVRVGPTLWAPAPCWPP